MSSLSWLEEEGFTPLTIEVRSNETKENSTIFLVDKHTILENDDDQAEIVSMMLYVKDQYNISGTAYHEMARLCKEIPRHYKLKQKISELNRLWEIYPTPNGTTGVQQSFRGRLQERL